MISNLENGPTEEDLELLLVGCNEEDLIYVDLRDEKYKLDETDCNEDFNTLNLSSIKKKENSQQKKCNVKRKKIKSKRKKNQIKDNSDKISIDSDEFVVPDDEVIPPDWEYNFERPIVCQNVTFYNKVDNILTGQSENNVDLYRDNERECNSIGSLDEDFTNNSVIQRSKFKNKKFQNGLNDIDIDKDYIDDKDNTALIVESRLLREDMDDEEQIIFVDNQLNFSMNQEDKAKKNDELKTNDSELIINEEILNFGIVNFLLNIMGNFKEFENYKKSQNNTENCLRFEKDEISTLLIIFKSIDIEFSNFNNKSFDIIQNYLNLFYTNILNSLEKNQFFDSVFLKELHFEMISFLETKFEEVVNLNSPELDFMLFFLLLRILGLTLLVENLLIKMIKFEKFPENKTLKLNGRFPISFGNENLLDKNNVSKILRQIFKRMLNYLLDMNLKNYTNNFHFILILTLFINCKLNGDSIFIIISEKFNKSLNTNFEIFLIYYYTMIIYSNVTDLKFDISKIFSKFIFDLKIHSTNIKECLSHYYLLNEYLKSVNIYQINNVNCKSKFETILYYLSDLKFLYNINKENQVNICLSLINNNNKSDLGIFYSKISPNNFNLEEIRYNLNFFEKKLKEILFLDFGNNGEINLNNTIKKSNKELNIFELTEEIYFNLLNLLINLIENSNELNLLLKFLQIHFEFEKVSIIRKNDIIMHYLVYNSLFTALLINSNKLKFEIPILDLYYTYLEENDKINNFLLTEMVLNNECIENKNFTEKIKLNKNNKLLIQTLLSSSVFGTHFELKFHIDILYNIITLIESVIENLRLVNNNLKISELFSYNSKKIIKKNISEISQLNLNELIFHLKLISKFNSNSLFAHMHNNTGTKLKITCKNYVDKIKNNLINLIIYFKVLIEETLDIYFESIYKLSDEEVRNNFIEEIFKLIDNLSILIIWILLDKENSLISEFLVYYFGLLSDKLFYYIKKFNKRIDNTGKQITELLILHVYNNLGKIIERFFNNFKEEIKLKYEIYSYMIVLYLLMFNIKQFSLKSYYGKYLKQEEKIFKKFQILNNNFEIPKFKNKKNISIKLENNNIIDYYIKKKICINLNSLYKITETINKEWKFKIKNIMEYIELNDSSKMNETLISEPKIFNINSLILELYFDYYISYLDGDILQIINKKVINYSINLYSSQNIFGLLINFILKGVNEKNNNSNNELILNWNHISNSIKGYINQLKDDLLINIWINYDFIQMFMVPTCLSSKFIYLRMNFWINILSIPLSKMLINSIEDFHYLNITLEYPIKYFKKLFLIKDLEIIQENIVNFSINFIIDSVRLIHLSYFKILFKMIISKIQENNEKYHSEIEKFIKLLNYMKFISQKIENELKLIHINNQFQIDCNTKNDIIDIISILNFYLNQLFKALNNILINKKECIHNYYDNSFDNNFIHQIDHELLKKKTEWVNYFIYSGTLNSSEYTDNQTKSNILKYILKDNCRYSLSFEFQKLPKIFQYIKKEISKKKFASFQ